jgi:hypothetical protein
MSYCRFSSENFRSDVYVYESVADDWVIHVACRKHIMPPIPELPWRQDAGKFYNLLMDLSWKLNRLTLRYMPMRKIGLPADGAYFSLSSPRECADQLCVLRAMGYHVPQYAIDALVEEANEESDND